MNKQIEACPYCKRSMIVNRHTFSKALARILIIVANRCGPGEPFHLQKDFPSLTKNQYANFQKLRYWGLIEKHYDFVGKRAGGYWRLTNKVLELINCHEISCWVRTFDNKVVEQSEEKTTIKNAVGYYDIPERWAGRAIGLREVGQEKQMSFIK